MTTETEDRRTKAQILAELEKAQAQIARLEDAIPPKPKDVPAAMALAGCIRALDAIPGVRSQNSYEREPRLNTGEIAQVLRHLIGRYGIDLTERVTEPCERLHLEDVADEVLIDRLRGRF